MPNEFRIGKEYEPSWRNLFGCLGLIRLLSTMLHIGWVIRCRRLTDEEFLTWATSKKRSGVFWGFASIGARHRYGPTSAVKSIYAITYAENPDYDYAVYQHVRSLYEDENWAAIAAVNIIPCLDGEDEEMVWTRQVHAYAQRQVDGSKGEFADD